MRANRGPVGSHNSCLSVRFIHNKMPARIWLQMQIPCYRYGYNCYVRQMQQQQQQWQWQRQSEANSTECRIQICVFLFDYAHTRRTLSGNCCWPTYSTPPSTSPPPLSPPSLPSLASLTDPIPCWPDSATLSKQWRSCGAA